MEPLQAWKDDYRRDVEEVLAERQRARENGQDPGDLLSGASAGRIADLVIPPAGLQAEVEALKRRLAAAEGEAADLRRRADAAEAECAKERERREKIKDAAATLAVDARGMQADLELARGELRLARERGDLEAARAREAVLDAEQAAARAEDAQRSSVVRAQAAREVSGRIDALQIELDTRDELLRVCNARLEAALRRNEEQALAAEQRASDLMKAQDGMRAEVERLRDATRAQPDSELAKAAERAVARALRAEQDAAEARAQLRTVMMRGGASDDALKREAERAAQAERTAAEAVEAARAAEEMAEAAVAAARAERAKAHEEAAAVRAEADRLHAEGALMMEQARALEADIPRRIAAEISQERAEAELRQRAADAALLNAQALEKQSLKRFEDAEKTVAQEGARLAREAETRSETAFEEGLAAEKARAEHAERELAQARRAEADANEKVRTLVAALSDYRDRMKTLSGRLSERLKDDRAVAERAVVDARRREAEALARLESERARLSAQMEEEYAKVRAEFEEERARMEAKMDVERAAVQERWREQAELLEKLRQASARKRE